MSNSEDKPDSGKETPPSPLYRKETGMLTERVELAGPDPGQKPLNPEVSKEETLLPHERDQTTKPAGTGQPTEHEHSRAVIGQAAEDTEHGLKDTDRRGVPSDIISSDLPAGGKVAKRTTGSS
ncbi:MAG: hypothetical protein H0X43_12260 [Nitrosospira sp.]|nr:hypothetical protein [Nitrosospira sp.]